MTTLREAATMALAQLKINRTNFRKGPSKSICKMLAGGNDEAIADLEAALAEPVQEPFGYLWPTGRHPEFRFTRQKRDGVDGMPLYTTPPQRPAEPAPVQEPVAWHYTNNAGASVMHWGPSNRLDADMRAAKDYPHVHKVTPLYTQPPQRKPLTDEEIRRIKPVSPDLVDFRSGVRCAEWAHGIGGNK